MTTIKLKPKKDEARDGPPEAPADVVVQQTFIFRLGKVDTLLMLKALGGRLHETEIEAARTLGDRLTAMRVKHAESQIEDVARLRQNLEAATGRSVEDVLKG